MTAAAALKLGLKLVVGAAALFVFLRWFERLNLYHPDRTLPFDPSSIGLAFEDASIRTSDGVVLHGWYFAPPEPGGPVVIVCHGNAGNVAYRLPRAAAWRRDGIGTLLFDWRGYGRSEGTPTEEGMQLDALAAYDWVAAKVAPGTRIAAFGESLGGSLALEMALQRPVAGVLTESSPTSTVDVGRDIFPFLPVRWFAKYRYDALERVARLGVPILIAHSPDDDIVGFRHGERLFAAAKEPKRFVRLQGTHNTAFEMSGEPYYAAMREFILGPRRTSSASP